MAKRLSGLVTIAIFASCVTIGYANEPWFERHWTADVAADIKILSEGSPLAKQSLEKNYSGHDWIVDSDFIETWKGEALLWKSKYHIQPTRPGSFELLREYEGAQHKYNVEKTESGFCVRYFGDPNAPKFEAGRFYGCFVPHGK